LVASNGPGVKIKMVTERSRFEIIEKPSIGLFGFSPTEVLLQSLHVSFTIATIDLVAKFAISGLVRSGTTIETRLRKIDRPKVKLTEVVLTRNDLLEEIRMARVSIQRDSFEEMPIIVEHLPKDFRGGRLTGCRSSMRLASETSETELLEENRTRVYPMFTAFPSLLSDESFDVRVGSTSRTRQ
jgi:hypothetical protein